MIDRSYLLTYLTISRNSARDGYVTVTIFCYWFDHFNNFFGYILWKDFTFTTTLFDSSVSSQPFTSVIMESPRITATSLDCLNFLFFTSFFILIFQLLLLFLFDKPSFGLADFLSLLGVAMFSRNYVVSFLCTIVLISIWSRRAVANQKHFL